MTTRIQDMPDDERPREKLELQGAGALSHAELIAIFVRIGVEGASAIDVARQLLDAFDGSVAQLARAPISEIVRAAKGVGPAKAIEIKAAIELGFRVAKERYRTERIDSPEAIYDLLGTEMRVMNKEVLRVVLLDTRARLQRICDISTGTANEAIAHPRDILAPPIVHSAHSFILVHNHPSGDPSPSAADRQVTRRVADASAALSIQFLDHVIVGAGSDEGGEPYFSFREMGLM